MIKHLALFSLLFICSLYSGSQSINKLLEKAVASIDSGAYFFEQAKKTIQTKEDEQEYFYARHLYFSNRDLVDSSLSYAKKYFEGETRTGSRKYHINTYYNIAKMYSRLGQYERSSDFLLKGLKLAENKNDYAWISNFNRLQSLNQHDFESYPQGIFYGKKAYEAALKLKDNNFELVTYSLNAIAINFDDWNKPDSALYYHRKIIAYTKGSDTTKIAYTYNNIGNTLLKQKKYKEAAIHIEHALRLLYLDSKGIEDAGSVYDYATFYTNLATIAYQQNEYGKADSLFDKAKYYVEKSNNAEKLRDYYQQRYLFNKARKNIDQMAAYQEKYITLRDSVFNTGRAKTFADLEKKYQTEKKEAEIKILGMENKRQRTILLFTLVAFLLLAMVAYLVYNRNRLKQKTKLQQAIIKEQDLAAKAVITAEENERQRMSLTLHDGLGQLLSVLKMNLQAISQNNSDTKSATIFNNTLNLVEDSIKEMRGVTHHAMPNNVLRTGLGNALKNLVEQINSNKLRINLNVEDLNQNLDSNMQLVLYRIFQEGINNVIKHAGANMLDIVVRQQQHTLCASIKDNGIGFDKEKILKSHKGIGLDNIVTRVKFLKGDLTIDSELGKGTTLSFQIPTNTAF